MATLAQLEKRAIRRALLRADGNVSRAVKELDISRQTLYNKAARYGWLDPDGRIDANLVADGRRCQDYWKPPELRDTATNQARKEYRRQHYNPDKVNRRDMGRIRHGIDVDELESMCAD